MTDDTTYRYTGSAAEDLLLAQLWSQMRQDDTFELAFNDEAFTLGNLIDLYRAPNTMFYKVDENGIWFVVWFSPVMGGAYMGAYLRSDRRGREDREAHCCATREIMEQAMGPYKVLIVVTQQEWLLQNIADLGYNWLGKIPYLFYGNDAWIGYVTAEQLHEKMYGADSTSTKHEAAAHPALV